LCRVTVAAKKEQPPSGGGSSHIAKRRAGSAKNAALKSQTKTGRNKRSMMMKTPKRMGSRRIRSTIDRLEA
ncbi:hypothetical protein PFISCL1PPCAC_7556, partial [Pristionchus fissidentatus]